tara:strand:- start:185 stop:1102 length:918 start_codon:yes stop_codon:yes gene_type:complete
MATQTVEQVQRLAPYLEGLEKRLLGTAFGEFDGETQTSPGLLDSAINLPQQRVAGLDPLQQQAFALAPQMFGAYAPFIRGAGGQTGAGAAALAGGLGMLADPTRSISMFMNPYEQQVIDQTMADIARAGDIQRQGLGAKAVGAGAFGGSRQAIAESELGRNVLDRQARAAAQLRQGGFKDALTASQRAAQLMGGLGQAYGQLAGTTADIGRVGSELGRADLGMLSQLGDVGRRYQQQVIEAERQNQLQQVQEPFTRLQLGQQLLKGTPSTNLSSTFKSTTTPDTNPFLAGIGAYTALQGVQSGSK